MAAHSEVMFNKYKTGVDCLKCQHTWDVYIKVNEIKKYRKSIRTLSFVIEGTLASATRQR